VLKYSQVNDKGFELIVSILEIYKPLFRKWRR